MILSLTTEHMKGGGYCSYKAAKHVAKKDIVVAKSIRYDRLYKKLETKEEVKEVFKLARAREEELGI